MSSGFLEIAFTPSVRAIQEQMGASKSRQKRRGDVERDVFSEAEATFIQDRDSFYMATVSETGWPYVQHRGGPRGFLTVIDASTLAFADYRGNRQYISTGNLAVNDRACLFLMDYARRARLKIYVRVEIVAPEDDPALAAAVTDPSYKAKVERIYRLRLDAFDWNCPQHITPRYTETQVNAAFAPARERLAELEAENRMLRERLGE